MAITDFHVNTTIRPIILPRAARKRAAEVLTDAFCHDPIHQFLFPDETDRLRSLSFLWQAVIGYTRTFGAVYTTELFEGAACWLKPGNTQVTLWGLLRTGFGLPRAVMKFDPESRKRLQTLMTFIEHHHMHHMQDPHWYLWALGVDSAHRGRGIGSALLEPVLWEADRSSVACYLETQSARNVAFYQRHGFTIIEECTLEDSEIRLWFMSRAPSE